MTVLVGVKVLALMKAGLNPVPLEWLKIKNACVDKSKSGSPAKQVNRVGREKGSWKQEFPVCFPAKATKVKPLPKQEETVDQKPKEDNISLKNVAEDDYVLKMAIHYCIDFNKIFNCKKAMGSSSAKIGNQHSG